MKRQIFIAFDQKILQQLTTIMAGAVIGIPITCFQVAYNTIPPSYTDMADIINQLIIQCTRIFIYLKTANPIEEV